MSQRVGTCARVQAPSGVCTLALEGRQLCFQAELGVNWSLRPEDGRAWDEESSPVEGCC